MAKKIKDNVHHPNWIKRAEDKNRKTIPDWEFSDKVTTHKLSYMTGDRSDIVYPNVQEINGKLNDFTDPKNKRDYPDAYKSALYRGDYLEVPRGFGERVSRSYKGFFPGFNEYKWGGEVTTEGVAGAVGTLGSLATNAINQAKVDDPSDLKKSMISSGTTPIGATDYNTLSSMWIGNNEWRDYNYRDFRDKSLVDDIWNGVSAGLQGSSAGLSAGGPIGAIIGGVVGTGSSIIGSAIGRHKARKTAREVNALGDQMNASRINNFIANAENIAYSNNSNVLRNSFKEGGFLNMKNKNIYKTGGPLESPDGFTDINAGGTHAQNPRGGVPVGYGNNGLVNLLEEGEVIADYLDPAGSYVFNNEYQLDEKDKKKLGLPRYKELTPAKALKMFRKEAEERPNDPIAQNTLKKRTEYLKKKQEAIRAAMQVQDEYMNLQNGANSFAEGGNLWDYAIPYSASTRKGKKYQNRVNDSLDSGILASSFNSPYHSYNDPNLSIAERARMIRELNARYPSNKTSITPSSNPSIVSSNSKSNVDFGPYLNMISKDKKPIYLSNWDSDAKNSVYTDFKNPDTYTLFAPFKNAKLGGFDAAYRDPGNYYIDVETEPLAFPPSRDGELTAEEAPIDSLSSKALSKTKNGDKRANWRYANAINDLAMTLDSLKPVDYKYPNQLLAAAEKTLGNTNRISADLPSDYMQYRPIDRNYYSNKLAAQAGATRRSILNSMNANPYASGMHLLAADNNVLSQQGDLVFKADRENWERYKDTSEFNQSTNQSRVKLKFAADTANAKLRAENNKLYLDTLAKGLGWKERLEAARTAAIMGNFTNTSKSISNLGKEAYERNMGNSISPHYKINRLGGIDYLPSFFKLSPEDQLKERALLLKLYKEEEDNQKKQ
jgi:hypothetical protein